MDKLDEVINSVLAEDAQEQERTAFCWDELGRTSAG